MLEMVEYAKAWVDAHVSEKGQGMVEYALIIAFVVAIAVYLSSGDSSLGGAISSTFTSAANQLKK